jgi:hypothetical protein
VDRFVAGNRSQDLSVSLDLFWDNINRFDTFAFLLSKIRKAMPGGVEKAFQNPVKTRINSSA